MNWINCPETDSPMPRLACSPVIYSDSAEKVVQFMEHNDKFLLRPTEKRVGFQVPVTSLWSASLMVKR